jgi:CheY-like chemotaxis protein
VGNKILVVEDDADVRSLIVSVLDGGGLAADSACDGLDALAKLQAGAYRLLISDIVMPGMNGIELFRKIQDDFPRLEAVFTSANATGATKGKLDRLGVFGFLEKPFSNEKLLDMARKALKSDRSLRVGYLSNASAVVLNKGNILVADDNADILNMMTGFLGVRGYHVTAVSNGSDAYEQILVNDYDLIIMDINMPKMNGIEAVKAIREHDPYTYIILISGEAESQEIRQALQYGANKFIPKPFKMDDFLAQIKAVDFKAISSRKDGQAADTIQEARRRTPLFSRMNFFFRLRKLSFGFVQLLVLLILCLAGGGLAVVLAETKALPQEERPLSNYMERMIHAIEMDWGR